MLNKTNLFIIEPLLQNVVVPAVARGRGGCGNGVDHKGCRSGGDVRLETGAGGITSGHDYPRSCAVSSTK